MQTVRGANQNAPTIAEECAIPRAAARAGGEVWNDHDVEFETLRLVNREYSDHIIELRDDLCLRFTNRRVMRAIPKVPHHLIERCSALPGQPSRDLD